MLFAFSCGMFCGDKLKVKGAWVRGEGLLNNEKFCILLSRLAGASAAFVASRA